MPIDWSQAPVPGAVDRGNGIVQFTVFAPGKERIALVGDFNGWDEQADLLEYDGKTLWSLERQLSPGRHEYQYVIDGRRICDPWAREVKWQPDEPETQPPRAVVEVDAPGFEWRSDNWHRPPFRDLIIYELHVADFTAEGTFEAAAAHLDYLADLGINAIELMPVTEDALEEEWGYQPTYYFACNHEYGPSVHLKQFIDAAHARNIAIIMDLVVAHTATIHPLNQMYPYDQSPWFGEGIGGTNIYGLPTFDHRKDATRALMQQIQEYWVREFHADGFRYDYAINIGIDGDKGLPFLGRHARTLRPDAYLIAEYLPEDPKVAGIAEFNASWHIRWSFAAKALARQGEFHGYDWNEFERTIKAIDPLLEGYEAPSHMINYIESHDEDRLVHELRDAGFNGDVARHKLAMAATLLLTSPGVPMIYHGQEFGETTHRSINERNPLRWGLLKTRGGRGLHEHYRRLIALRHEHPALRADTFLMGAVHNDEKWVVFHRWDENRDEVVVAANFSPDVRRITMPFPGSGAWHDVICQRCVKVGDDLKADMELQGLEIAVFVRS